MNRHAYIVLAHNEPEVLKVLLRLIDDERNDIFLHIDKKTDIRLFGELKTARSHLVMLPRMNIIWGGDSQMRLELMALSESRKFGDYSRYHIISGVDLPLKSQDFIHDFFDVKYPNREFVGFSSNNLNHPEWRAQWEYPYFFADRARDTCFIRRKFFSCLRGLLRFWFKLVGWRQIFIGELKKGSNWVSVTQPFVDWLLAHREIIERQFKHVFCSDEKFLHTAIWNSPFRDNLFDLEDEMNGGMREIDWERGTPYVWRMEDFENLMSSDRLFARKFSSRHMDVIYAIRDRLMAEQSKTIR